MMCVWICGFVYNVFYSMCIYAYIQCVVLKINIKNTISILKKYFFLNIFLYIYTCTLHSLYIPYNGIYI